MKAPLYSAVALTLFTTLSLGTPSGAHAKVHSFKPVDRAGPILSFRVARLARGSILSATVVTGNRRQAVRIRDLRRANARSRPLRVRVRALTLPRRGVAPRSRLRVALRADTLRTRAAKGGRPNTSITDGPSGTVSNTTATFTFSSDEPSPTFQCRLDSGTWTTCSSPRSYEGLALKSHTFQVRARDAYGRVDRTPATRSWLIVAPPPETTVPDPPPETTVPAPPPETVPEEPAPSPTVTSVLADFTGSDGTFVSSGAFWNNADMGLSENPDWFAESGTMYRRAGTGWTNSSVFRMWTRRTDLAFTKAELDVRFNGWSGGTSSWHGVNLWLNYKLASGSKINDGACSPCGYAVDFNNRDGNVYIQKKTGVDAYHLLAKRTWSPARGTWYRWGGRVIDNGNGTNTIQVLVNGQVVQQATDDGSVGGPRLMGGRVGVRSDYSDVNIDNLTITRP